MKVIFYAKIRQKKYDKAQSFKLSNALNKTLLVVWANKLAKKINVRNHPILEAIASVRKLKVKRVLVNLCRCKTDCKIKICSLESRKSFFVKVILYLSFEITK